MYQNRKRLSVVKVFEKCTESREEIILEGGVEGERGGERGKRREKGEGKKERGKIGEGA
jgi:hypothetical protein